MKNFYKTLIFIALIFAIIYWIFFSMMPQKINANNSLSNFSTNRALNIIKNISVKPHYIGSEDHDEVANYLFVELQKLGLQPEFQEGFSMTDWGNLTYSKNIIAKINGTNPKISNGKALLLLSHYDSAPHSFSHGASDDASGVATILEGVRAFLHSKSVHKNDIIILFTDAEELGLNGAALFVTKHKLAKKIGLAINFEARGTAGPSYMLMESNKGNAALINEFNKSNVKYPAANSLMYSIYKMLPNDTDLTVFREQGKVQGFNFAFIDDHFNYHTQQDDFKHLDPKSIEHNGTYLMPMLNHFANSNLNKLNSPDDFVYFNTPFGFIYYPFSWVFPMWIVAFILFCGLLIFGIAKKVLDPIQIAKGFIPMLISIIASGLITFLGWKLILLINPEYKDILHGFTYNGHYYLMAFTLISMAICLFVYDKFSDKSQTINHFIAPLFIWILINLFISISLKGAGYFIIPVLFGLLILAIFIIIEKANPIINFVFSIPALLIFVPFVYIFPVGLGLKIMFGSSILITLIFNILTPVLNQFTHKKIWFVALFIIGFLNLFIAQFNTNFEQGKAKPNSLLYIFDADKNQAFYTTYDTNLDDWTTNRLGEKPEKATQFAATPLYSKYGSEFTFAAPAPLIGIEKPKIEFITDSISGNRRFLKIKITPNRKVNRYDIFANEDLNFKNFKANGESKLSRKISRFTIKRKILSYYVVNNFPLEMEFSIDASKNLDMEMLESSFDLLENEQLKIENRQNWMMPMPFVLNDAVVLKQTIVPQGIEENVDVTVLPTAMKP